MKFTTPTKIPDCIEDLKIAIGSTTGAPIFVRVAPAPGCRVNDCFVNAEREAKMTGGEITYGWLVWECDSLNAIEVIFHAVVKTKNGEYEDVTPQVDGENAILFIPEYTIR